MKRERDKLEKTLGGIREMTRTPSAVWIVDTKKEHLAVEEARKLRIPIIGILDTNCDPDEVDFPIPGNDDAIRAVSLLTRVVADAVAEGLIARSGAKRWWRDRRRGAAGRVGARAPGRRRRQGRRRGHRRRRRDRGHPGRRGHRRVLRGHRGSAEPQAATEAPAEADRGCRPRPTEAPADEAPKA